MSVKVDKKLLYITLLLFCLSNLHNFSFFSYSNANHLKIETYSEVEYIKSSTDGFIASNDTELFWFIHISDTQFLWYDADKIAGFYNFLNETYSEISPLFIFHTGDIVDANSGLGQDVIEWENYKKALDDNNMNMSIYMDIIGNHDSVHNPGYTYFLNYSMMGLSLNATQYSFNYTFSFGQYAFIGLNTAKESYNLFEFGFQGFLNSGELDWYESELKKYKDFNKIFVFGHNPPSISPFYEIISEESLSGKDFNDLNEEYNVSFYLSGHVHENSFQYFNNLLTIITTNFDQGNGTYRIVSLDSNRLSTSVEEVGDWPQAIITNPPGEDYLFGDLNTVEEKLRVLAWDPQGNISVKWGLFDSNNGNQLIDWEPLERISNEKPLWESNLDFTNRGYLTVKVKIEGGSGELVKELRYNLDVEINSPISLIVLVIMIGGFASIVVISYHFVHNKSNESEKKERKKS